MKKSIKHINIVLVTLSVIGILTGSILLLAEHLSTKPEETKLIPIPSNSNVLFLSSYNGMDELVKAESAGIADVFYPLGISCKTEFMNSRSMSAEDDIEAFYKHFSFKIQKYNPFSAVIVGDDAALRFTLKYRDELFTNVPIVFLGINDLDLAKEAAKDHRITGTMETLPIRETIDVIIKLFPRTKKIHVFADSLVSSSGNTMQFYRVRPYFPGIQFEVIQMAEFTLEELSAKIASIPKDEPCYSIGYFQTPEGYSFDDKLMHFLFYKRCKAPYFSAGTLKSGKGPVGCVEFDHFYDGQIAAKTVVDILAYALNPMFAGEINNFRYTPTFDAELLKKFNVKRSLLPKNSVILNERENFYAKYKLIFFAFSMIIISFLIMLTVLGLYSINLRRTRSSLNFSLTHDHLTGLHSRPTALREISSLVNTNSIFSIIIIDIDNFQQLNDFYSHDFGDKVLCEMTTRLCRLKPDIPFEIYRFGGDEFMLIFKDTILTENSRELYLLKQTLSVPFEFSTQNVVVKNSMGIVTSAENFQDFREYTICCDLAKSEAKLLGKSLAIFYNPSMKLNLMEKHQVRDELENAINSNGFKVVFQPQIETGTKNIFGYEALLRLKNGKYTPGEFIPVAEEGGFMQKLGRIMTEQVLRNMAEWRDSGMELKKVSINYSAAQMNDSGYSQYLKRLLEKYDISPEFLCIEITESILLADAEQASILFKEFSDMRIKLALDDFGTGYSSFNYLTYIPVSFVKLDKTLIDTYLKQGKFHVVQNLITFVHGLNMKVIIEGIEQSWQVEKITEFSGDYIQGYFFSKPLESADVTTWQIA